MLFELVDTVCKHRAIIMLLNLVEKPVKVGYHHATYCGVSTCKSEFLFKDKHSCRYRVIIILRIQEEVPVKVGCWSTADTAAIIISLILVEVLVKVGCWSTTDTASRHRTIIMLTYYGGSTQKSQVLVHNRHSMQA